MGHERWFRGQHDGHGRPFDWRAQARQHGVPEQRARALYEQAVQQARGAGDGHVQALYLALLAGARQGAWRPAPGKVTRTMRLETEQASRQRRNPRPSRAERRPAAPGKVTLTSYLAPRGPAFHDRLSERHDDPRAMDAMAELLRSHGLPAPAAPESPRDQALHIALAHRLDDAAQTLDDLPWTMEAPSGEAWPGDAAGEEASGESMSEDAAGASMDGAMWPEPEQLPEATRSRMERAFGHAFGDVVIHPDSPEATGATRALARGREIHFRAGAYEPGTAEGDRLIAHELAHVVQQTARPGQSAGRRALEREADRAAGAILAGQRAAVSLGASTGAALAFSDSEDHDLGAEEAPAPASADAATDAGAADTAAETSAGPEAEGAEGAEGNEAALLAEIRSPVPAEGGTGGGGGGAGGGGGGEAALVDAAAPEVSGSPPEQGLAALHGVRPDKLAGALDGVRTAASGEVAQERSALAADPPQQMSTGDAAAAAGAGAPGGATDVAAGQGADGQPMQAGAAAAGENTQAVQGKVDNAEPAAASHGPPPPVASASAPAVDNAPADQDNASGGLSEADAGRMSDAIAAVPTHDPHANPDPGPPPELAMSEDARAGAQRDRDALDTSVTDAETTAATHIAQPMGEDHIDVTLAPESLEAELAAGATAAEAGAAVAGAGKELGAAKAEALGDAGESAAIIAQLERGAEIDAALATAQGQVATERQAHAQRGVDERARADQEIAALKTQSQADQEQARTDARAQVDQARTDWQAEVDTQTEAARTEADAEVKTGLEGVEAEQSRANSESQQHIDKGREDAEAEQKKGEDEAERVKKEKEDESSGGFFGWIASKAKAFFEGVKKAISSVLDAARKAIKRVIEVAKKLAVAVIEAARKAIVATIKAVGKALIAIGDRLLAAFPALRERFRNAIQGLVDQAVEAVNALADSLKENVQKALDLMGKGLDAALGLLERGLHAIVDGVNAVVQGAISFAKGVVEALGAFAVLIKDIAGDPGGWLGKLGSAVMDGIRNHLWSALKIAALAWFQSKVLELLGVGGMVVQLLMEGGIDMGQISSMAWEALQTAIPIALITILIEKLVSMIVPAAGAVLAIIEGLAAAWGTVSRIIAAFGAFVAFLKAIKGGGAGPQFATLLAAAAVVVLDFVANWLLRKLASAARKVGAKLKKLADKFKNRRKARKRAKTRKPEKSKRRDGDEDSENDDKTSTDLRAEAQRSAQRGWNAAQRRSARRVVRASELEDVLRSAERSRGGIRVNLELVQAGDQWKVRATARQGTRQASAEAGHGWITRSKSGSPWFAGKSIKSLHQQLVREARRELREPGPRGEGQTVQKVYDAKARLARTLERSGQQRIEQQLEGIRYTIRLEPLSAAESDQKIQTRLLIEPNYEEMELQIDAAADDVFEQLVKDLEQKTKGRTFKHEDVILGICERIASPLGIQWSVVYMQNRNATTPRKFILVKFQAKVGGQPKEHKAFIVQNVQNTECAACEGKPGVIEPHNVVPQTLWRQGIRNAFGALGVASETDFMGYIIEAAINWSASRRDSQKQCEECERPGSQSKSGVPGGVGPNAGSDYSLIARGTLPNAGSDDSIIGKQFGGKQADLGDRQATTRAHIARIISLLKGDIKKQRSSRLYASDPVITAKLVDDGRLEATMAVISAEIYRLSN